MRIICFVFLLLLSCSGDPDTPKAPVSNPPQKVKGRPRVYGSVPPNAPHHLPVVHKFPGKAYKKVVAYELTGNHPNDYSWAVFQEQTGKKVDLNATQVEAFLRLINNRNNYKTEEMACFEPRIGLVFYDTMDNPVACLSLCMNCHNMCSEPLLELGLEHVRKTGFNEKALGRLDALFTSWGF